MKQMKKEDTYKIYVALYNHKPPENCDKKKHSLGAERISDEELHSYPPHTPSLKFETEISY